MSVYRYRHEPERNRSLPPGQGIDLPCRDTLAARNLADVQRYNLLPLIADKMGLTSRNERTLWKDRALVELNQAVLHSFDRDGVRLVDHHTASKQFLTFTSREHAEGREVNGDWSWLVPPVSGSTSPIFHRSYPDEVIKPGFFYLGEASCT